MIAEAFLVLTVTVINLALNLQTSTHTTTPTETVRTCLNGAEDANSRPVRVIKALHEGMNVTLIEIHSARCLDLTQRPILSTH
jgi:hypothetical protein